MAKHVILFLAANPDNTSELALGKECAAIERALGATPHRADFDFRSKWAVTVDDLQRHLLELQPAIIHFSGHGVGTQRASLRSSAVYPTQQAGGPQRSATAQHEVLSTSSLVTQRDVVPSNSRGDDGGIYLQDEHGRSQLVTARALAMMIRSAAGSSRVVVLNACYSDGLADELRTTVDCVVGMTGAIRDDAARSFAVGFYGGLGHRRSIGNAVENARTTLAAKQLREEQLPRCRTRDAIDANEILLGAPE